MLLQIPVVHLVLLLSGSHSHQYTAIHGSLLPQTDIWVVSSSRLLGIAHSCAGVLMFTYTFLLGTALGADVLGSMIQ